jgi:hypothetical protein
MASGGWNRGLTKTEQVERRAAMAGRYFCTCGALKTPAALRCQACKDVARVVPYTCACGAKRARVSSACRSCYLANVHAADSTCQWCKKTFRRRQKAPDRDARKFCSKVCYGASKTIWKTKGAGQAFARCVKRELTKRLRAISSRPPDRRCLCGATIERRTAKYCRACYAATIRDGVRAGLSVSNAIGSDHVCPNCGDTFRGYPGAVFCSVICGKRVKRDRYPSLQWMPIAERNQLARWIALAREANRRLQREWGNL